MADCVKQPIKWDKLSMRERITNHRRCLKGTILPNVAIIVALFFFWMSQYDQKSGLKFPSKPNSAYLKVRQGHDFVVS